MALRARGSSALMKIGIFFNGVIALVLAVPIVRYLLSPISHENKGAYDAWISLGGLDQFPAGQTRLATYRNPVVNPWDGDTADIACNEWSVDSETPLEMPPLHRLAEGKWLPGKRPSRGPPPQLDWRVG